ncbi:MAG: FAD binding domain-containing protein, partial [Roseiarcus sp.]
MPVSVKTFPTIGEAAAALSLDRGARYLGGGTLVMRALNEGDVALSTIVRVQDRGLNQIRATGGRVTIGAGVTLAQILAERELAFLHATARSIGGPAVRNMGTVGGNLHAPSPFGDLAVALLALDATVSVQGGFGAREMAIEEFLAGRDRAAGSLVTSISCQRPAPDTFRYRKISRIKPKGASVISIAAHVPNVGGRVSGVRIAY